MAYLPAFLSGFVWDDDLYVSDNPHVRTIEGLWNIWFHPGATPQYYPLTFTSFWLEHHLWGDHPFGYHAVNVLLHALNAGFLWVLLNSLGVRGAWLAAALFALHPLHVESVAWITERKNVLSGMFYLAAAIQFLRFARLPETEYRDSSPKKSQPPPKGRWIPFVASQVFFVCALLSKTVTCTLPAALSLVLCWKRGRQASRDLPFLIPMFVLGLVAGVFTAHFEKQQVGAAGSEWSLSIPQHILLAGRIFWFYLIKFVWPVELIFIYPKWEIVVRSWVQWLYPAWVMILFLGLWFLRQRWARGPLVAGAIYAVTIFPALGFFNVYFMQFSWVADHFAYLASFAPFAIVGVVLSTFAESRDVAPIRADGVFPQPKHGTRAGLRTFTASALLLVLGVRTFMQCLSYQDAEVLWRDTLALNPKAWIAHNNLGLILQKRGGRDAAREHYQKAIALQPDAPQPFSNLGMALAEQGRFEEAVEALRRAIEIDSSYFEARYNLATASSLCQEWADAEEQYREAVRLQPRSADAGYGLAVALKQQGRIEEAGDELKRVLRLAPDHGPARKALDDLLQASPAP